MFEIGLIAIREVSPPFDEYQQYWRPYQPKHSPSQNRLTPLLNYLGTYLLCPDLCLATQLVGLSFAYNVYKSKMDAANIKHYNDRNQDVGPTCII